MLIMLLPILAMLLGHQVIMVLLIANVHQLVFNYFYIVQFSCAALALKSRFEMLNKYIERCGWSKFMNLVHNSIPTFSSHPKLCYDKKVFNIQQKNDRFDIELFSELYDDLCDLIEIINKTFTSQLVFVMAEFMSIEIFSGYGILREVLLTSRKMFLIIGNLFWIIFQYPVKFFMASAGSGTTDEAEKSLALITKLINRARHDELLRCQLNNLLIQLQCRNKKLSNVFFNINYNVILVVSLWGHENYVKYSIKLPFQTSSTILTYLIITCQFDAQNIN